MILIVFCQLFLLFLSKNTEKRLRNSPNNIQVNQTGSAPCRLPIGQALQGGAVPGLPQDAGTQGRGCRDDRLLRPPAHNTPRGGRESPQRCLLREATVADDRRRQAAG